jgi:hypothetical protein
MPIVVAGSTISADVHPIVASTSPFVVLRRALSLFKELSCKVVGLFLDTNSKIWNFAPTRDKDSSARVTTHGLALYPPFISMHTRGTLSTFRLLEVGVTQGTSSLTVNLFSLVSRSRPMFAVYANQGMRSLESTWDATVDFAMFKLDLNTLPEESPTDRSKRAFTLLAVRYCVMTLDMSLCSTLVASHLATLREYSEDRSLLKVGYQAEPLLGEAASHLLRVDDDFTSHVEALANLVATGNVGVLFSKGNAGEFVASVLLSRAYDKAAVAAAAPFESPLTSAAMDGSRSSKKCSYEGIAGGGSVSVSADPVPVLSRR